MELLLSKEKKSSLFVAKLPSNFCTLWIARPMYRKSKETSKAADVAVGTHDIENSREQKHVPEIPQLNTQKSFRQTLQEVKLVQVNELSCVLE